MIVCFITPIEYGLPIFGVSIIYKDIIATFLGIRNNNDNNNKSSYGTYQNGDIPKRVLP